MFDAAAESVDRTLRDFGNILLDQYGRLRSRSYDIERTIILSCTGRGGSTWLAQIIQSVPGHQILWEQLHWKSNPAAEAIGLGRPTYLPRHEDHPEVAHLIKQILSGRQLAHGINTRRYFSVRDLLFLRAYVAKFVTANLLLPWIVDRFHPRCIHLLRHPCAVVSSQMIHGEWDEVDRSFCRHPRLFDEHPHLGAIFEDLNSHEEVLAFNWAVQTFVPLRASAPRSWLTTTYEHLVCNGREEVERIFSHLGDPIPERVLRALRTPSATTVSNSNVSSGRNPLTGWRERLTPAQIDAILYITHAVGIESYTDALLPDVDRLPDALPSFSQTAPQPQ